MKKKIKILLFSIITIVVLFTAAFFIYVSDYYKADELVVSAMLSDTENNKVTTDDNLIIIHSKNDNESALIFYPGAKVEAAAYYPLLSQIAEKGITCILVKMPFHFAIFDSSAADNVYEKLPDIKNWYIGGHSLGGAMASNYMSKHPDKLKGLVLLGAYIYGDISPEKALTIYGTKDLVLNRDKITYKENIIAIKGGNHAYFGNYGEQKGDGTATITRAEQQRITASEITEFITRLNQK